MDGWIRSVGYHTANKSVANRTERKKDLDLIAHSHSEEEPTTQAKRALRTIHPIKLVFLTNNRRTQSKSGWTSPLPVQVVAGGEAQQTVRKKITTNETGKRRVWGKKPQKTTTTKKRRGGRRTVNFCLKRGGKENQFQIAPTIMRYNTHIKSKLKKTNTLHTD